MIEVKPLERLETGVPGLDEVLNGGLLKGGSYIVTGASGTGKTVLTQQIAHAAAARGGRSVMVTLLVEEHARLISGMSNMKFFGTSAIPEGVYYVSGFPVLEAAGLEGLFELASDLVRGRAATLLVLDCLDVVECFAQSPQKMQLFMHELKTLSSLAGCTALMVSHGGDRAARAQPLVDGVLQLERLRLGMRSRRLLEALKTRGSSMLEGAHDFVIDDQGITVFPRLEVDRRWHEATHAADERSCGFGVHGLDDMLRGGVARGTVTLMVGSPGSGKSSIGLHFLTRGSTDDQPGLLFGFNEGPARLIDQGEKLGLAMSEQVRDGHIEILWQPPLESSLDALGCRLLEAVRRRGVRRLVIDSIDGLAAADSPDRLPGFLAALTNELRALDVTALFIQELRTILSHQVDLARPGTSAAADNLLLLRHQNSDGRLLRMFSIVKVRGFDFDPRIRQLSMGARGVVIGDLPRGMTT